ncbi:MAG: NAD(P)/FAD-dependent oxidoreductase [Bacteroidales bacterium]
MQTRNYILNIDVLPEVLASKTELCKRIAQSLNIHATELGQWQILRQSLDARHRVPKFSLKIEVLLDDSRDFPSKIIPVEYENVEHKTPVIIVGTGPAGLFAALKLLQKGMRPILIEQGKCVKERKRDIAQLSRSHQLNPQSNLCFGEGGAGTFSDGKLYTRSNKRGNIEEILHQLVSHGASPEILIDTHPHIGTDKLPQIIANIRHTIEQHGGVFHFNTKVVDFILHNHTVKGIIDQDGNRYEGHSVILATGHSAQSIYHLFAERHWELQSKEFAVGLRVEHPQALINEIQYHSPKYSPLLPAASYSLVAQVQGRGVFSFCMCPGGQIVPASTQVGSVVVNGMSNSQRNSPFANAGIVTQILPTELHDFKQYGVLAGLYFQQHIEQLACLAAGNTQCAPAQRLTDFVNGKSSSNLPKCSYVPGVRASSLHSILPPFVAQQLREGFKVFEQKKRGFLSQEAIVLGVESRTSSPIRIVRDKDTLQHLQLAHLYPCGEGAGYAGGITSSAIDGVRCAEKIVELAQ